MRKILKLKDTKTKRDNEEGERERLGTSPKDPVRGQDINEKKNSKCEGCHPGAVKKVLIAQGGTGKKIGTEGKRW